MNDVAGQTAVWSPTLTLGQTQGNSGVSLHGNRFCDLWRVVEHFRFRYTNFNRVNSAQDSIRSVRAASNAAIAARDASLVVSCMLEDVTVSVARGPVLKGRDASRAAFAEQFADRAFAGYVREPTDIVVDAASPTRATERGRWTGRWRRGVTQETMRGTYVAEWRLTEFGWFIQSEVFTPSP